MLATPFHDALRHKREIFQRSASIVVDTSTSQSTHNSSLLTPYTPSTNSTTYSSYSAPYGYHIPTPKADDSLMYNNQYFSSQGYSSTDYQNSNQSTQQTPTFVFTGNSSPHSNWQMYQGQNNNHMSGGISAIQNNFHRSQGHQRNTSESTINTTGPSSPYMQHASYPYIANPERSPSSSSSHYEETSGGYQKSLPTPAGTPTSEQFRQQFSNLGYDPAQASHTPVPAAHLAMKNMSIDHHHNSTEDMPEFSHSSRQSVSSRGQDSPSTPNMDNSDSQDETRPGLFKIPTSGETNFAADVLDAYLYSAHLAEYRQGAPRVELFRTESAACADELYNPENFSASAVPSAPRPAPSNNNFLSPSRNLINERIRNANSVRSQSPAHTSSRDRSPFRTGSPLAPSSEGFKTPNAFLASAADARRQQKEAASVQEWSKHQPILRREPTKTMSPRDAVLDYNEADASADAPLFPDSIPPGYQKHFGGTEAFLNNYINATPQRFANIATPDQPNMASFRASSADTNTCANANFNFLPPAAPGQVPANPYSAQHYRPANFSSEPTPDFPAHLTSMESSISEGGAPASSQGSAVSIMQRPQHTQAGTGTYTCTSVGCSERFDSPARLAKHRREAHQARPGRESYSSEAPTSPGDSASPEGEDTLGSGMTSAALAARNSQAGPHKCTRINPSTNKPCNSIFSRPYDLTRHEDTIHNRGKQKVRCQYCREEKSFSRNDALTRHMRVVHPEVDFHGKRSTKKGDQF